MPAISAIPYLPTAKGEKASGRFFSPKPRAGRFTTRVLWTLGLVASLLALGGSAHAAGEAPPFQRGERLAFQISWSFIPAALATLEVAPAGDTEPGAAFHFILTARTLPVIDMIYRYRERVDSWVAADVLHTLRYKKVQESTHPRDIEVRFDWQQQTAQYRNYGQALEPIPIQPGTLDPLSALYYIRSNPLTGQADLEQWVTDGKKLSLGKAIFVKRETITIRGKAYQTIKIEPDLKEVKGVFEKSPGAKMYIWLTDDERKLLVKLTSKVRVGSFVAELIEEESVLPGTAGKAKETPPARPAATGATGPAPWSAQSGE